MKLCFCILAGCWLTLVASAPAKDLITHLPGMPPSFSFVQYSGYLTASPTKHFHYWFAESQEDPVTDPVVLWLNGGPGCSSLDGYLSEIGPFHVNDNGETLYHNPYSWNKIANVLFLESPAGVGFSYDDNGVVKTDDDQVSQHNYQALIDFFKKFPEYQKNEFFIAGESYAGVYIPTLSVRILQGSFKLNFKGVAIGNGVLNSALNINSLVFFAYYHGLYGETYKNDLAQACCDGDWLREKCNFTSIEPKCLNVVIQGIEQLRASGLNQYALYRDCYNGENAGLERFLIDRHMMFPSTVFSEMSPPTKKLTYGEVGAPYLPCVNASAATAWLNKQSVKEALHVKSNLPPWIVCNPFVGGNYTRIYHDLTEKFQYMFEHSKLRILVYNGDTDMVCNFLGDEWFVDDLKRPITKARAPWYVEGQVAGFVKTFDRLTFTTIRGSGHMVPQWAPDYAYNMFMNFINDKPFTTM